jgi:small-conductance mechanosensitive channel
MQYPVATIGTIATICVAFLLDRIGSAIIRRRAPTDQQRYGWRGNLTIGLTILTALVILFFWARLLEYKGTFFGLLGAGFALAMRDPLLSIAGRLSIWAGHMYRVGDRIEFNGMTGDVVDIGFFYTRMLEIGKWIPADQATGRIVQFPNASVYHSPIFNYTQNFSFIWDEVRLPITYSSNVLKATEILVQVGEEYTQKFVEPAQSEIQKMRNTFLLPDLTLKPVVYTKVTSNYVELNMRYLVDARHRRDANSWLYWHMLNRLRPEADITIGSDTMNVTLFQGDTQPAEPTAG